MIDSNVVAKVVTMNTELLKELPLAEVLELHPLLNARQFAFGTAEKVKPMKARPINTILDKGEQTLSVWDKLLLSTLEGSQSIKRDCFVCWGVNNDVWQQARNKVEQKYTPTEMDEDGWVTYVPKEGDDATMNSFQVDDASVCGPCGGFAVINPWWGDERVIPATTLQAAGIDPEACGLKPGDMVKAYLHYGKVGDWVLQNRKDAIDIYRVASGFFDATYEVRTQQG